jgi:hypothetical protein
MPRKRKPGRMGMYDQPGVKKQPKPKMPKPEKDMGD